ncbi:putative glutathione S-transferase 7 [Candidatus Propionivibrio aalborgensis]|jgi:glutathione S-transferase|uniref:Putative glutathione S-transferase 7 n=1 Tax=Candidatus Propionivibrio aalborgensis TaxID=1860101 RepID=A0A1A8XMU6_9RHOO|nr:glutathione S-transferase family protein [Candidatus Propionivibrio aalborgensis]MBK7565324.1 glutathione S-transferase family protein [Propionivibrio sp.]SBT06480.1 putative glutathione S-transferase 7 [Candidatus Propionivibrio aalborgensis]HRC61135.1 glutathione S-transferase family protein [Candidatus Propionivibrio aalborgensis]
MSKPRLIYFDFAGSRGEECRIALHLAGVDFDDVRIPIAEWPELKPQTPFGSLPILEIAGKPPLAESNAILVYIGRQHGLHPKDALDAAYHEALMSYAEDLRHNVGPTLRITDEQQKRSAREELARNFLPTWGTNVERQLGDQPFVGGDTLSVVDIKLYMIVRWFVSGTVDHVPSTVFDHCPKLKRLFQQVGGHAGVKAWLERAAG